MCTLKMAAYGCSSSGLGFICPSGSRVDLTVTSPKFFSLRWILPSVTSCCVCHKTIALMSSPLLTKLSCLISREMAVWGPCGALCRVFFQVRDLCRFCIILWICKLFVQECMFFEVGSFVLYFQVVFILKILSGQSPFD